VVTLSGEVADEATKTSAETSVRDIKGVKSVVNNITVKKVEEVASPVVINSDDALRNSLDSVFSIKKIRGVNVSIDNGVVTLTGAVKRVDLTKVIQAANEARPKKVINKLTIQ
jgi:osmotically-inducible protein OsmY